MKRTVLVFGLIAGIIVSVFMAASMVFVNKTNDHEGSMVIGYASMIVAFTFVFVGIKNYRDKYNNGVITFGQAFKTGLYITLIASTIYVLVWNIEYYLFMPDFMDKYAEFMIKDVKESGASQIEIDKSVAEMAKYKEWYKNPLFVILFTYIEILPVGILITLISSLILKTKSLSSQSI